jgi:hypothetical protein
LFFLGTTGIWPEFTFVKYWPAVVMALGLHQIVAGKRECHMEEAYYDDVFFDGDDAKEIMHSIAMPEMSEKKSEAKTQEKKSNTKAKSSPKKATKKTATKSKKK